MSRGFTELLRTIEEEQVEKVKAKEVKVDDLIAKYVEIRDKLEAIKARQAKELEPYEEALGMIEMALLRKMQEVGVSSFKGEHGTAYMRELKSIGISDWNSVLEYIRENGKWDLLTRKIVASALEEGEHVPGTEVSRVLKVNVRRK